MALFQEEEEDTPPRVPDSGQSKLSALEKMKAHTERVTARPIRLFTYHNRNLRYSWHKAGASPLTGVLKMAAALPHYLHHTSTDCKT